MFRRFAFLPALVSCAALSAAGADPALQALALSRTCAQARQVLWTGSLIIEGQLGEQPLRLLSKARVRFAAANPGRRFLHLRPEDKDEYFLISNGEKSWAFVPKLKRYTETAGAFADGGGADAGDGERDLAETIVPLVIATFGEIHKNVEGGDAPGPVQVRYGGKKQMWPSARLLSKDDPRDGRHMFEIAFDPGTARIGRIVWSMATRQDGERLLIRTTVDFEETRIGEDLGAEIFEFTPPRNALLADALPIPGQTGSFLAGRPAPDFELRTLEGERLRLSDFRGRPVLLNFWASWCGPCRRELPVLSLIHLDYEERGLVILGVNDEGRGTATTAARELKLPFRTLDDGSRKVHSLYRVQSIPSIFLIGPDGRVVRYLRGAQSEGALRAALRDLGL